MYVFSVLGQNQKLIVILSNAIFFQRMGYSLVETFTDLRLCSNEILLSMSQKKLVVY